MFPNQKNRFMKIPPEKSLENFLIAFLFRKREEFFGDLWVKVKHTCKETNEFDLGDAFMIGFNATFMTETFVESAYFF